MPSPQGRVRVADPGNETTDYRSAYLRSQGRCEELAKERDAYSAQVDQLRLDIGAQGVVVSDLRRRVQDWEADGRDWDAMLRRETAALREARRLIRRVEGTSSWERVLRAYERLKRVVEDADSHRPTRRFR